MEVHGWLKEWGVTTGKISSVEWWVDEEPKITPPPLKHFNGFRAKQKFSMSKFVRPLVKKKSDEASSPPRIDYVQTWLRFA